MRIRLKQIAGLGVKRSDSRNKIDNVVVKESLLDPSREVISIFFRGKESSGILDMTTSEFEMLINSIVPNVKLVDKTSLVKVQKTKKTSKKKTSKKKTSKRSRK